MHTQTHTHTKHTQLRTHTHTLSQAVSVSPSTCHHSFSSLAKTGTRIVSRILYRRMEFSTSPEVVFLVPPCAAFPPPWPFKSLLTHFLSSGPNCSGNSWLPSSLTLRQPCPGRTLRINPRPAFISGGLLRRCPYINTRIRTQTLSHSFFYFQDT